MEEAGRALIGPSSTNLKKVTIAFTKPFSGIPVIAANTLQTDPAYPPASIPDTYAVSVTGVTSAQFTANIVRVDAPGHNGWGQKLSLGWTATTP